MEEDLLGDLIEYRKSKDKAVTSAARGLLKLYREVNPNMLKRRERVCFGLFYHLYKADIFIGQRGKHGDSKWECAIAIWP